MSQANKHHPGRARTLLLALPPVVLAAVVFHPLIRNYFFADDFLHLYQIAEWSPLHFVLEPYAGHVYLIRNALFWTLARTVGPEPAPYFWLALLTHLLNVALLYRVVWVAFASDRLAC